MRFKRMLPYFLVLLAVPAVVIGGAVIFHGKYYAWVSLCIATLALFPFFGFFEKQAVLSKELAVLSVMVALSVAGRFVFAWLPGFKPVTAITVISALWLGKMPGFLVGAFSAALSNFYFGQGPWTPFQMLAWGLIGFLAGLLCRQLQKSRIFLCAFGALAGVLFSLMMDVWTVLWADGGFNFSRYFAAVLSALPVTAEYALSNVVFLLLLCRPIGEKLERITKKYGLFQSTKLGSAKNE